MDVIEAIRRACKQSSASQYRIAKDTGIDKSALSRFVSGERGLSMENVDALCRYLGLELKPIKRKAR
jgi:transcriptional regulator with XRE-family HTH domain